VNKKFFTYLRRFFIVFFILLFLFFSTAFIIAYFFENSVKDYIVKPINKQLNTEITVKNIHLSLLKRFPYASLTFVDVIVKEALADKKKDDLLKAETVHLQFNIFDLFDKNYKVKKIEVVNARLNLKIFKDGRENYRIIKPSADSLSDKNFKFDLQKLIFNNVSISYHDLRYNENYACNANKLIIKGMFSSDDYSLHIYGNLFVNHIISGKINYVSNKKATLKLLLQVNNTLGRYDFKKGEVKIEENAFEIAGHILHSSLQKSLSLSVKGKNIYLQSMLREMPETYKKYVNHFEGKGILDFQCTIKGKFNDNFYPIVVAYFKLENAELFHKKKNVTLEKINLMGEYTNGSKQTLETNSLQIKTFSAVMKSKNIKGDFSINNFVNPEISIVADAELNLQDVSEFLKFDTLLSISGEADISLVFKGKLADFEHFTKKDFVNSTTTGKLNLKQVSVKLKNDEREFKNLNGRFQFKNNDIHIDEFTGMVDASDFKMKGYFSNIIPYLLIPGQKLQIDADISSDYIDVAELIREKSNVNGVTDYNFSISDKLDLILNVHAGKLKFNKFEADKIVSNIRINNRKFFVNSIAFSAMNGNISGTAVIESQENDKLNIKCDMIFSKVDIQKAFFQFNSFGQKSVTEKNIKGSLTATIQMISCWNTKLEADLSKLVVNADLLIENGELNDYEPIQQLSKFLKVADLNHITFSTLKNQIEINNRIITFPGMEIKSSALNLYASGSHHFDNSINYKLRLLLSDLLAKKARNAKKENEEFGVVEDDGLNKYTLYILVSGSLENPEFKYDTKGLKNKIIMNVINEKQNLKNILKEEFKWLKKDTTLRKDKIEKQENNEFIIEWDENPKK